MLALGDKATAILRACTTATESAPRAIAWQALEEQFSKRAVNRKTLELIARGYLTCGTGGTRPAEASLAQSWLTDKGRHALESRSMGG